MLCVLLAAALREPMITLECPGRPLMEVMPKLAEQAHVRIDLGRDVENLSVVLRIRNQPWSEVKTRLAWAVQGSWVESGGNWTLTRTQADQAVLASNVDQLATGLWEKYLSDQAKTAKNWGAWTDQDLKVLLASDSDPNPTNYPRTISHQAALQLAILIGAAGLSQMAPGSYYADPPLPGEKPFPPGAQAILQTAYAAYNRLNALANLKRRPICQAILLNESEGGMYLNFLMADDRGFVNGQDILSTLAPVGSGESWEPVKREPLVLSARAVNFAEVALTYTQANPKTASPELIRALNDPVEVDPTETFAGEVLLKVAEQRNEDLVAAPNLGSGIFVMRRSALPFSEERAVSALRRMNTIQTANGWMTVRPIFPETEPARATMRGWVRNWRSAKSSEDLALRLWNDSLQSQMGTLLMYSTQRMLNKSLSLGGSWDQPLWKRIDPVRPFHDIITLSGEEAAALSTYVMRGLGTLEMNASGKELAGASLEGGAERNGTYLLTGTTYFPLIGGRAFPHGLPRTVEITFTPDTSSPVYYLAETEVFQKSVRTNSSQYGAMLRDFRSGARKTMPKFFWTPGRAGGILKIDFGNRITTTLNQSTSAVLPNEAPRPISELPKKFLDEAEQASRAQHERTVVPPR